jgi:hypothetical protein
MADKTTTDLTAKAMKKVVSDIQANKSKASEFNGAAGKAQQQFMKKHDLDRKAFNFVVGLDKQEPVNQQASLRGVIKYAHLMGMFDEVDMYDDMVPVLEQIIEEVNARRHNQTEPDNVTKLATGGDT